MQPEVEEEHHEFLQRPIKFESQGYGKAPEDGLTHEDRTVDPDSKEWETPDAQDYPIFNIKHEDHKETFKGWELPGREPPRENLDSFSVEHETQEEGGKDLTESSELSLHAKGLIGLALFVVVAALNKLKRRNAVSAQSRAPSAGEVKKTTAEVEKKSDSIAHGWDDWEYETGDGESHDLENQMQALPIPRPKANSVTSSLSSLKKTSNGRKRQSPPHQPPLPPREGAPRSDSSDGYSSPGTSGLSINEWDNSSHSKQKSEARNDDFFAELGMSATPTFKSKSIGGQRSPPGISSRLSNVSSNDDSSGWGNADDDFDDDF